MRLLPRDVLAHCLALRCAYGECAVTLLPSKRALPNFVVDPARRNSLNISHHICETSSCAESNQEMHMVSHPADRFGHTFDISDYASEVGMHSCTPRGANCRRPAFRAENNMIMQREMRRCHDLGDPAPPPGRICFISYPVRWLTPPANFHRCFAAIPKFQRRFAATQSKPAGLIRN